MPSEKRYEMDSNELYDKIAGLTGEDVETIASLGFEAYAIRPFDETERERMNAVTGHSARA